MATEARVRSLDALESFRSSLIVFLTKARSSVAQVTEELRRTRAWLMNDQRVHWTEQCRKRARHLDQAKSELLTARRSNFVENVSTQELAVRRAKQALEEAEQKLANVKRWTRDLDRAAEPLERKLESLQHYLMQTLPEGVTQLGQLHRLLESYAETSAASSAPPAARPAESSTSESPAE